MGSVVPAYEILRPGEKQQPTPMMLGGFEIIEHPVGNGSTYPSALCTSGSSMREESSSSTFGELQQGYNKGTPNFFLEEPLAGWARAGEHMAVRRGGRMALLRGHKVQAFKPKDASYENDFRKILRTKNSLSQRLQIQLNCGRQAYEQTLLGFPRAPF